jgi:nucleoside permease NupC
MAGVREPGPRRRPRRRGISPAARARRALLVDVLAAGALAALALSLAAGLGVVAFVALPALLAGLLWAGAERLARRLRARRSRSLEDLA